MINPAVESIIHEFKDALLVLYGDRLRDVVLYGSCARGDYNNESDIDLMVVLTDEQVDTYAEIRRIAELEATFLLQYGLAISPLPVSYANYLTSFGPVYQEVRKEDVFA
ncbi:nucleotidyltransferase domain-containing protein [Spirosoma sp. KUDC1026]|uniref:nucleotidyltransferase domain-containing protein n=1 Tax=Spirosoma sp. KUDC1026 TaxID=2745947 RepID=UPI00159BED86|nr:nucleotidyltransferase domain-containing protein [Spirosoma sp. KUDC1026]QKZ14702.1 nucleotidyltransferase domain-containing protein [Spirosoma sp. KUDC1026]